VAHKQTLFSSSCTFNPRSSAPPLSSQSRRRRLHQKSSHPKPSASISTPSRCPHLPPLPQNCAGTTHHNGAPSLRGRPGRRSLGSGGHLGLRPWPGLRRRLQGYVPVRYRAMCHNGDCRCVSWGYAQMQRSVQEVCCCWLPRLRSLPFLSNSHQYLLLNLA
jgi:hypothetical protein